MNSISRNCFIILILFGLFKPGVIYGQDITIKVGIRDSINSSFLKENRKFIVRLPAGYDTSKMTYPVLYLLDGTPSFVSEIATVAYRLRRDKLVPEMIVVGIIDKDEATRNRVMMPVKSNDYPGPGISPQGEDFLAHIEKELIPHIEKKYRTNGQKILQGKSLSGLFTLYALLAKPTLFNSYIGISASWFAENNDYFMNLSQKAFENKNDFKDRKIYVSMSLMDSYDPDKTFHQRMLDFSELLRNKLGNTVSYKYQTYDNYGHVPVISFYDGLRFVFETYQKK